MPLSEGNPTYSHSQLVLLFSRSPNLDSQLLAILQQKRCRWRRFISISFPSWAMVRIFNLLLQWKRQIEALTAYFKQYFTKKKFWFNLLQKNNHFFIYNVNVFKIYLSILKKKKKKLKLLKLKLKECISYFLLKECSSLWASGGLLSLVSCSRAPQQKIFAKLTLLPKAATKEQILKINVSQKRKKNMMFTKDILKTEKHSKSLKQGWLWMVVCESKKSNLA